jgi:multiple sugar transport system substrate-binding protein
MKSPRPLGSGVSALAIRRRTLLKGALGVGALGALGATAACGGDEGIKIGSNFSDELPKKGLAAVVDAYGKGVGINTVAHNDFQENITNYLKGGPDDVFTWFAGYRMQYFAEKNLVGDLTDVWGDIGSGFSAAMKQQSTGTDGKQYFVPFYYYPWAVFYRKSVFEQNGYQVPSTLDQFTALAQQMQADGLVPLAFGDKDGWPAFGTFDYLDLRINGYEFHRDLMAGEKAWNSPEVKTVFDTWRGLLPYHQPDSLGRTWQEAMGAVQKREAAMYVTGLFAGNQFDEADRADLDFFAFPEVDAAVGTDAVEAPIDGFMLAARPRDEGAATELLRYLGSAKAEDTYLKVDPNNVAAHDDADASGYSELQKKSAELVGNAKSISQFLDRDTVPSFASTVMIPQIQEFIRTPDDIDGVLSSIESQKKEHFT